MWDVIPYREDKNLGKAYNDAFRSLPSESVLCLRDYDTLWLTHDYNKHLDRYHAANPDAVLTCYTNRISPLSKPQLLHGKPLDQADIKVHIGLAEKQYRLSGLATGRYEVTAIDQDISGMVMVIPRKVWELYPFYESGLCLGVDTDWNRRIRAAGIKILRMNGLYIWHTYRLVNGIHDKKHLK